MKSAYDAIFRAEAGEDLDWKNLKAQALAESGLEPDAVSKVGAMGLAQFMAPSWKWIWRDILHLPASAPLPSPFDPDYAIEAQAAYMRWLLRMFGQDWRKAWAAYNWGQGRVAQAFDRHGLDWLSFAPQETRDYVARIERIRGDML
jgi:membrane-bound lytic murein transglycosylase D